MLSSRGRYATRAMLDIAMQEQDKPILIQDISKRQKIPLKYLQQILVDLKQAGIVTSRKGPGGGYVLARPAEMITLLEVLEAVEGPITELSCTLSGGERNCGCPIPDSCAIRDAFCELSGTMSSVLTEVHFGALRDGQRLADSVRSKSVDFVI
jgi:Rrf2 family protein